MRHLTTEELLLHCDDALAPELVAHVRECDSCHEAWLNLQEVLAEAEEAIRSGVPEESLEHRVASRQALEVALFAAKQPVGFQLRWPAVYAAAAALTFMVLGGYWQSLQQQRTGAVQVAKTQTINVPERPLTPQPIEAAVVPSQPLVAEVAQPAVPQTAVTDPAPAAIEPASLGAAQDEPVLVADTIQAPRSSLLQLARVEPKLPAPSMQAAQESKPASRTVIPEIANRMVAVAHAPIPHELEPAPAELLAADFTPEKPDPAALPKLVEGYWILTQAHVWQEDLRPVMTAEGLRIEGTVEDAVAHNRVEAALLGRSIPAEAIHLRLRRDFSDALPRSRRPARVIRAVYSGPAGGTVRRALLGHFSDAARRSFVAPGTSALEGELVRYVSEIYRHQSELLAHVYALQDFLGRVDSAQLVNADPLTVRKFRDVVRFHVQGIDARETAIYDRLSEALPRKFWIHRGENADGGEAVNWHDEGNHLLRDTLELDSNLTALFGGSSLTVDAADPDQSCGELLNSIRTRIRRIKSRTQAL